jgi:ribosome maturation protein Sdo1
MTRGEAVKTKVHYKGKEDDFIVFVDDLEALKKWKTDSTIPLADVVSGFKVFVTHKQGTQGQLDSASNSTLDNEFGTHVIEEVINKILKSGNAQESTMPERQGIKNDSQGPLVGA